MYMIQTLITSYTYDVINVFFLNLHLVYKDRIFPRV